jgi:ribosomal-protein-alanine N-acetyltransferase
MTELRTERLLLRPVRLSDFDDLYEFANDPEFGRFLTLPQPSTRRDVEMSIARSVLSPPSTSPTFAIELNKKVVGTIRVDVEKSDSIASVHYFLARSQWNKGLMTEAVAVVVAWGFSEFDLAKVYSFADVRNVGSWRVMEKVGMTCEGTLRGNHVIRGERCDFYYFGILRDEWVMSG